ncbi:hypothetical protein [Leifsonia virtsii]|uniref:Lipoprotein n=1 Tax=Leifsonia virtsii TaxID=3035915 RepID=A0ABT8ISN5_9MICO|nr:hypothetical protein [Leifsonia virtsii]MDN4595821.1 hypothetical protein [Leifsonia virtsii]
MHIRRRPLRALALAASIAVAASTAAALTGCTAANEPKSISATDSPLFAVLGPLAGFGDDKALRAKERKIEELTAACMTKEGFEYTPSDRSAADAADDLAAQQTEDWVAKNGYGLTAADAPDTKTDPNQEYVDSLSPSEQEAYNTALHGAGIDTGDGGTAASGDGAFDPATAGCYANAQRTANGGKGEFWEDEKYAGLLEKMSKIYETMEKKPEVVAAARKWSDCMADAGYSGLTKKSDALERASKQNAELYGLDDGEVSSEDKQPSAAEKKKVRDAEIALALADFRCDQRVHYTETQLKAQFALEDTFIQQNRAKLDALVDAYGSSK